MARLYGKMSVVGEMRSGGDSRKMMLDDGRNFVRCPWMAVCSRLVSSVVFCRRYFVGLASFVSTLMMIVSVLLNVICRILFSVCGRV